MKTVFYIKGKKIGEVDYLYDTKNSSNGVTIILNKIEYKHSHIMAVNDTITEAGVLREAYIE